MANRELVGAIDDVLHIQGEGRLRRQQAEVELGQLEAEWRRALSGQRAGSSNASA